MFKNNYEVLELEGPEKKENNDDNSAVPEGDDQDANDIDQHEELTGQDRRTNRRSSHHSLPKGNDGLGSY